MPSAAARRLYEDQIPPFMTVFDLDAETLADRETVTVVDHKLIEMDCSGTPSLAKPVEAQDLRPMTTIPSDHMHKHHDSTSTQASESAESSPTTTLSTTDSSPLTDPSPSSSPDSPVNLIPLNSFPATSFSNFPSMANSNNLTIPENSAVAPNGRPMTSPMPRRPKNMKGLSIMPPCIGAPKPAISNNMASEPASPSFIKPTIPAMKRKPSQLSLNTNSSDLLTKNTLEVPSTPSMPPMLQRRALKHSTSTPHMLAGLKSATFGPPGGMGFPKVLERNESGLSEFLRPSKVAVVPSFDATISEEDSPIRAQVASRAAMDAEPFHENERNEDQKTPGYPDGPIAIYENNVFLYLEPSADEAAQFDTVINVAREVKNPFKAAEPHQRPADESPIPDTAVTTASFATAFEFQPEEHTPTTPKASAFPPKQPEYIHMLWDHNTDIAPDLMHLCETIESRTKEGKRVLVHCQQGASRSASLIIAYGLYRNPELSVNDAYYAAQARSQWISPNMKLMYCLQDFQKQMTKRKASPGSAYRQRPGRSPTKHRLTLSADAIETPMKEPRTAPLPGDDISGNNGNDGKGTSSPGGRSRGYSTPNDKPITPGPSSAPSSFAFAESTQVQDIQPARFDVDRLLPQAPQPPTQTAKPKAPPSLMPPPSQLGVPSAFDFGVKPPPSPGFGSHRFGSQTPGGFSFASLNLGPSPSPSPEPFPQEPERPPPPPPAMAPPPETTKDVTMTMVGAFPDDDALMSPRAEAMTNNPLHEAPPPAAGAAGGMHFVEEPPTPNNELFSPRESMFPRHTFFPFARPVQVADPRSPPAKGEAPIVRSIDEIL